MSTITSKIFVVLLIFLGEALAIYAEMIGARSYSETKTFASLFFKMFLIFALGSCFLLLGYMMGFNSFKNIWIVSAASITSILIIEPILAYSIFHQLPTKGAFIGLIFGTLGFIAAIFI